jgi:SAM-dependent methyltransferase
MPNLFGTPGMAAGYASSRPPVHAKVMERVREHLGGATFRLALDVGCGAGLSTRALAGIARHSLGIEPAEAMLRWTSAIAPDADFVVGKAEAIPVRAHSVDLLSAAGALNYVNLELFFPEAARVLQPSGVLVVYDFRTGRTFRGTTILDDWFSSFVARYPWPPKEARELSPEILDRLDSGFRVTSHECFEIGLTLTPEFYLDYMLTETNVAYALRNGVSYGEIRSWCAETLRHVWNGRNREVLFFGYLACMRAA